MKMARRRVAAAIVALSLVIAGACGGVRGTEPDDEGGERPAMAQAELPSALTVGLELSSLGTPPLQVVRSLDAELVTPYPVSLDGLKWPRLELADGSPWPSGWEVLPGDLPFGVATDGIPAARRFTWPVEILRTAASGATDADVVLVLEHSEPAGGGVVETRSNAVHVEFPGDSDPHEVGERDVREAPGGKFLLRAMEYWPEFPSSTVAIGPGGSYRARAGGSAERATPARVGLLSEEQQARIRDVLEQARVWEMVVADDEDFRGGDSFVTVVLAAGDAGSVRRVRGSTLRKSAAWGQLARLLAEITGVEIPAK